MFKQFHIMSYKVSWGSSRYKRGFTLLETMLALSLLVMVVLIISIGFASATRFSGDTTVYQILSNKNDTAANKILSSSAPNGASAATERVSFFKGTGYAVTPGPITVCPYSLNTTVSVDDPSSEKRHVFVFYVSPPPAPGP